MWLVPEGGAGPHRCSFSLGFALLTQHVPTDQILPTSLESWRGWALASGWPVPIPAGQFLRWPVGWIQLLSVLCCKMGSILSLWG